MADNRNPKYSGMLNLVKECGPVNVEIDTDSKKVIVSLENLVNEYKIVVRGLPPIPGQ